ncbi:hypothetical protein MMC32_004759 [Xylographa parallela]|nr:hypothetical protein [Xylographa parallela]
MAAFAIIDVPAYDVYWGISYINGTVVKRSLLLQHLRDACNNYFNMAIDLDACHLPETYHVRTHLRTLIRYFYNGASTTARTAARANPTAPQTQLLRTINARLTAIATALMLLGEDLTQPLPAALQPLDVWRIPNAQALELLVTYILQGLALDANLGQLKAKMFTTRVVLRQVVNAEPHGSTAHIGLPVVIFVCMTDRQVACSGDSWGEFSMCNGNFRKFRKSRFSDPAAANAVTATEAMREGAKMRCEFIWDWCDLNIPTFKQRALACALTQKEYNLVVSCLYATQLNGPMNNNAAAGGQPLTAHFGYNHSR